MTDSSLLPSSSAACDALQAEAPADADLAARFKALGDPTRLHLLRLIAAADGREACVCELTDPVGLSQPTVSHHMKHLVAAGLVTREQRGRWAYYSLVPEVLADLGGWLLGSMAGPRA
ncbi:hypothetical protein GCM10009700_02220 [Brevibacterium sanguinis]|uniref:ArsR/SmtB family transcription factor n=1 Tax=Brevibacterium sanguinis TaxID=232444 RepID=UPI0031D57D7E